MYADITGHVSDLLIQYHELISGQVKAEVWEEICSKALILSQHGSDWTPDYNHGIGTDQITDNGVRISNKGGSLNNELDRLTISGSRLTRFETIEEKIDHIHNSDEDYIFCLATTKPFDREYFFIVIDADKLDYSNAIWTEKVGTRGINKGKLVGWEGVGHGYSAKITRSMSDQLWTEISSNLFLTFERIKL